MYLCNLKQSYGIGFDQSVIRVNDEGVKIKICEMKKFIKKFNTSINVYSFGTIETYFMPVVARL